MLKSFKGIVKNNKFLFIIIALRNEVDYSNTICKMRMKSYLSSLSDLVDSTYPVIAAFHSQYPKADERLFWRCFERYYKKRPNDLISLQVKSKPEIISKGKGACELYVLEKIKEYLNFATNDLLIKITGRYRILNLGVLLKRIVKSNENINFFTHPRTGLCDTGLFAIRIHELDKFLNTEGKVNDVSGDILEKYATDYVLRNSVNTLRGWPVILIYPFKFRYGLRHFCTELVYSFYSEFRLCFR